MSKTEKNVTIIVDGTKNIVEAGKKLKIDGTKLVTDISNFDTVKAEEDAKLVQGDVIVIVDEVEKIVPAGTELVTEADGILAWL